jgi:class 3 adenylate cyclase
VTFLLTDIEGSTAAWEADADAMASALARHDELVEQVVTSRGGRLIKTRGEGDATFSVFERPSGAAAAAIELQDAITHEPWALREPQPESFNAEALVMVEIDTGNRIAAVVTFDLDARYLAGEAATYARPWSVITRSYAALNRQNSPRRHRTW